ncbi:MAG: hypothetical protein IPN18_22090 [Ignavibacteriales bacterium]|nr:hypothetical protein [Ignavibacteriales bacterium]
MKRTASRREKMKCVVCTSSLDLGVDFSPVDTAIQIGESKGIARLMQRPGRSGHQPGAKKQALLCPNKFFLNSSNFQPPVRASKKKN